MVAETINDERQTANPAAPNGRVCRFLRVRCCLFLFATLFCAACGSKQPDYVPKPKGYPRLELPPHQYVALPPVHPYQFEVSRWARILPDTFARSEPHWIFIDYPTLGANVQLTYKPILNQPDRLRGMLTDAYRLVNKHNDKASAITEQTVKLPGGRTANLIDLTGDVPTQVQFITTDTTTHFLRGALYFKTATQNDSLQPVIQYIRADVLHLLKTLRWRGPSLANAGPIR